MNYIKHLAAFFGRVSTDDRLNPTHISMYVSLFQFWNANRFQNPISISRNELMKVSKISAKATYHKCIRELHDWQYLQYQPSFNPFKGSLVYLTNLQTGDELALGAHHTKIETGSEQALVPYINNTNIINKKVVNRAHKKNDNSEIQIPSEATKEKSCAKKEIPDPLNGCQPPVAVNAQIPTTAICDFIEPNISLVKSYFLQKDFPAIEAEKFHNYFQSNGWLVGGKAKMRNWQAAANSWMLNTAKYTPQKITTPQARHLHTSTVKNYNEPL